MDDKEFLIRLGKRFEQVRGQKGISRKQLAQMTGVTESYYEKLEAGSLTATPEFIKLLKSFIDKNGDKSKTILN